MKINSISKGKLFGMVGNSGVDKLIKELSTYTKNFLYIQYYSHTDCQMYKIDIEDSKYNKETIVLSSVNEGIKKSLLEAIEYFKGVNKLTKDNFSGWEVFREIMGKQFSVKICDKCLEKQDKILSKAKIKDKSNES